MKIINPPTLTIETTLWQKGHRHICGLDEAGRGCLAGPVVAAAVVMPPGLRIEGVNDSKCVGRARREELAGRIREEALAFAVGACSPALIDEINILHAAMEAMRRATDLLALGPDYLLVDGNHCFPEPRRPFSTIIGGDRRSHSIAAASILAKTERDRQMRTLHNEHPHYGWITNVGYPTREHYRALREHGPTIHHRRSFRLA